MKKIIHPYKIILSGSSGSAIVIAMMTLLIVTIIGIATIDNSITEKNIATNDILHQQAFYATDGGTEMAEKLTEQNIDTFEGFSADTIDDFEDKKLNIVTSKFWLNDPIETDPWIDGTTSDADRDFFLETGTANMRTNFKIGSKSQFTKGGAIQMAAGYEGRGKGASGGVLNIMYDIYAQHKWEDRNVQSTIKVQWRYYVQN